MPRQGNTVESCIIASWKKSVGEEITHGDILCEIETDKAMMEVESPATGTVLALFFEAGAEVPVLTHIAVVGEPGEDIEDLRPDGATDSRAAAPSSSPAPADALVSQADAADHQPAVDRQFAATTLLPDGASVAISPRARNLAENRGLDFTHFQGTGPGGRIIERDIQVELNKQPLLTPLAKSMLDQGGYAIPERGSGVRGRVMAEDLLVGPTASPVFVAKAEAEAAEQVQVIPVKGIRQVIATRMLESLQTTAQLTLNTSADARTLLAYRHRLKTSSESLGLQKVTINDLILLAVSRMLPQFPQLNALFQNDTIYQYGPVHLGLAVDTPRGLMVPVIRDAQTLSLKQLAEESRRLASACLEGRITPDELSGGTFTVTNLGSLGIESFTPVLNPPQVGILGVGNVNLKPIDIDDSVQFIKHIGLSLTINHQVVDGAPAARFLQALAEGLAELDLLLAI
jgi:pyruvate dehydrogenase E2 component (dihydrolipoamide acetyltransferase)